MGHHAHPTPGPGLPDRRSGCGLPRLAWVVLLLGVLAARDARAATLEVMGSDGRRVLDFRWLIEEDATYNVVPGVPDPKTLAVRFHASHMPVVAEGRTRGGTGIVNLALNPAKRYFVSVLPDADYSIGGVGFAAGQAAATAWVNKLPLPTAQLAVFVFEDAHPINSAPDVPQEAGLSGFRIHLADASGRMMMDGFGNPIGTIYDSAGNILAMGQGFAVSDREGEALIKNLAPGKYTVFASPPPGEGWIQTTTAQGTRGVDAWVKAGEPPHCVESGPPGRHVSIGFVRPMNDTAVLTGGGTIRGQVVGLHTSRPPDCALHPGAPVPAAWAGLNESVAAGGRALYAAPCDDTGSFAIPSVPPGAYELVLWDENLVYRLTAQAVTVAAGGDLELGAVPIGRRFFTLAMRVFMDRDEDGFPDPAEPGIADQAVKLRFRDGSLYQASRTDASGKTIFSEIFPFLNWLVAEVDGARFKPTGATIVIDHGGPVPPDNGWARPSRGMLNPQPQLGAAGKPAINPNTGNNLSRTQAGGAVVQAFQGFGGQAGVIEWGKSTYGDGGNGGIRGMVYYATTRAEDDPRYGVGDPWEPGIPRVQVNLYRDGNANGIIDDRDGSGSVTLADVDHYPFTWRNAPFTKGAGDLDRNGNGKFDFGDALNVTATAGWDDNTPMGAQGAPYVYMGQTRDCFDGRRNFNQVRPGVFDGAYQFTTPSPASRESLPEGTYIVEAAAPPGCRIVKEEDRNVDFGDALKVNPLAPPPACVGDPHRVPAELSLFPGVPCKFAGKTRPLADRKQVTLARGQNAACDFHMFTEVPVAGHIAGCIRDDAAGEPDPNAPTFGGQYAPPWLPISIQDWTGREIARTYADQYGRYNALVPSTYSINLPSPGGISPGMLTVVINHPGPILDQRPGSATFGKTITDPFFNRRYGQRATTFESMPGRTTYLDTPVTPVAAFAGGGYAGGGQFPLDMEYPDGTPVIHSVSGPGGGPFVSGVNQALTIVSAGKVEVPNPLYGTNATQPKTIKRDYGFGAAAGKVTLGGVALTGVTWTDGTIRATVPAGAKTGQLQVVRANGKIAPMGLTVTVGPLAAGLTVRRVQPSTNPKAHPIQDAIDQARPGDLILVAPGRYDECVVMWKPVQLQGWGAAGAVVSALDFKGTSGKRPAWRDKVKGLIAGGSIDLLPGQDFSVTDASVSPLPTEEGAGILVLGRNQEPGKGGFGSSPRARIDGLTVTGGSGGGIVLNGYARYVEIANNCVVGNTGVYGGGIRAGHPALTQAVGGGFGYVGCENTGISIHNNQIKGNGGQGGAGGGIALYTGCDGYLVANNWIVGNFTAGHGGGIGQSGLCNGGRILGNKIYFNQCFNRNRSVHGGGIHIGGAAPLSRGGLSPGAGSVKIHGNTIQGNQAGAGDGGGIRLDRVSGADVAAWPNDPGKWFRIDVFNNFIVNNQAGLAGGGVSLQDAAGVYLAHNTIAMNESTATAGLAFAPGSPNRSTAQPAGVVARAHSAALKAAFGAQPQIKPHASFSNPWLVNNIIWQNRSFHFVIDTTKQPATVGLQPPPTAPLYDDLAVLGVAGARLSPMYCVLTDTTGYHSSNIRTAPGFVRSYENGDRGQTLITPDAKTQMGAAPACDAGGNFIPVRFGPLTLTRPGTTQPYGDYHLLATSPARDKASPLAMDAIDEARFDCDNQARPNAGYDIGADEFYANNVSNAAPYARNDQFTLRSNQAVIIPAPGVLANDLDANGGALTASRVGSVSNGVLVLNAAGGFTYSPKANTTGNDSFTYKCSDGQAFSFAATATLRVTATGNTNPVARNDAYSCTPGRQLIVGRRQGVLGNDTDADGDTFFAVLTRGTQHGALSLKADGSFIYTPAAGFNGGDTFQYQAADAGRSLAATVTINVTTPVPASPPAPTAAPIMTMKNLSASTRVLPNDPNPGNFFTYALALAPRNGTATLTATGIVSYAPNTDFLGTDAMTVTVTDQGGLKGSVVIAVSVTDGMTMPGGVITQFVPDTDGIDTDGDGITNNDHVMVHLGAGDGFAKMADGKLMYTFGFSDLTGIPNDRVMMEGMLAAGCPGPTLRFRQGQRAWVNLTNTGMAIRPDLADPHTIHLLGFPQAAPIFNGMPEGGVGIRPGGTICSFYKFNDPGTYLYQCQVEAAGHTQMGMAGSYCVTPLQDGKRLEYPPGSGRFHTRFAYNDGDGSTGYDVERVLLISSFDPAYHDAQLAMQPPGPAAMKDRYALLNGRGYPDTIFPAPLAGMPETLNKPSQRQDALIEAAAGQRILLRLANLNATREYTMQCAGLTMQVVGIDAKLLRNARGEKMFLNTQSVNVGSGETYDIILDTAGLAQGTYFLYTTNLNTLSNDREDFGGLMTEIRVGERESGDE